MSECGKLSIVGTPIGNMGDFSPRGAEKLGNADYIACEDTRVTAKLLGKIDVKKPLLSYYKPKEHEKSEKIIALLLEGKNIALVSDAGMPCVSDPGYILVKKCYELDIPVEVVPGANAAVCAVALSGLDAGRFTFEGFLPVDKKERSERLSEVKNLPHALVFYEAPHKLAATLADLADALGEERNAALCRELTKIHEETLRGTLDELSRRYQTEEPRGEYVIVIEGKSPEKKLFTAEEAAVMARKFIDDGMKASDACKEAAKITGVPKREIYAIIIE